MDSDGFLEVDTTRPETIFGDVAVAVHPEDSRYQQFHGKYVLHPFSNEPIPIVTDDVLVSMELGTGTLVALCVLGFSIQYSVFTASTKHVHAMEMLK